jgi:hypothetical protein
MICRAKRKRHCGDATMLRDNLVGLIGRCPAARESTVLRCALPGKSYRTIDPHALKIPAPKGSEPALTENATSPFQAEPKHCDTRHTPW